MTIITLCISIALFLFIPYYLNIKKLKHTNSKIIVLSLLESLSAIAIAFLIFLQGFFTSKLQILITIFVFLISGLIYTYIVRGVEKEWDIQNENIKNSLIIFIFSIFSFMIGMTIFRFLNPFVQILLTFSFIVLINFASKYFKIFFKPLFKKIATYFSLISTYKYFLFMIVIAIVGFFFFVFRLPLDNLKDNLNLLDHTPYLKLEGFPTDIQNDFRNEVVLEIDTDVNFRNIIIDYYYDDEYLYVYDKLSITVFDINQKTLVNIIDLPNYNLTLDTSFFEGILTNFFVYDDELFLLGAQGFYSVTTSEVIRIDDLNYFISKKFIYNDELYLYRILSEDNYMIYKYVDGNLELDIPLNNSLSGTYETAVISDNLFYVENDKYVLYEDNSISFDIYDGTALFNKDELEMYYVKSVPDLSFTRYVEVKSDGSINDYTINRAHNSDMTLANGYLFLTEFNDIDDTMIEIINPDFEIYAIKNLPKKTSFYIQNDYFKQYLANFHSSENDLEYLRVDKNRDHTILSLNLIYNDDVAINLPIYTHFGLGYLIIIVITIFIPITNYRKYITTIGFEEMTRSKKENIND